MWAPRSSLADGAFCRAVFFGGRRRLAIVFFRAAAQHGAALGDGHEIRLSLAAEPVRWVDGRTAVANLEVQVRRQIGIGDADRAALLALGHALMESHVGSRQGTIDRVIAPAMLDDDRRAVCP